MAAPVGALRRLGRTSRPGEQAAVAAASVATCAIAFFVVTQLSGDGILAAIALGVGFAVCVYCFVEERTGRTLTIFLLYTTLLDGYLKLSTGSTSIVAGRDAILFAIAAGMLLRASIRGTLAIPPLTSAVVVYLGLVLVQLAHPDDSGLKHSVLALRPHLEWVPLFFIAFAYMRTARRLRVLFLLVLVVTTINGIVALVQYQLTPAQLAGWGPGYSERIYGGNGIAGRTSFNTNTQKASIRPFGLGSDVGFGGNLAIVAAPAALALFTLRRRGGSRLVAAVAAAGIVTALVTSQARIALVLAAVAVLSFAALGSLSRRRAQLVGGLLVASAVMWLAVTAISSQTDVSVFDRYQTIAPNRVVDTALNYKSATFRLTGQYLGEIPFGAGLGTVGPGAQGRDPGKPVYDGESEFNYLLVELGLPGLLLVSGFVIGLCCLAYLRVPSMEDDEIRPLLAALGAVAVATAFGFAGAPVTAGVPLGPLLWLTAGTFSYWLLHLPRLQRRQALLRQFAAPAPAPALAPAPIQAIRAIPGATAVPRTPPSQPVRSGASPETPTIWVAYPSSGGEQNSIAEHGEHLAGAIARHGWGARLTDESVLDRRDLPEGDVVWLQYNPFAYARWGVAPRLLRRVQAFTAASGRPRLCLCIHEPYIPLGADRTAPFALWQRAQLRSLVRRSDLVVAVSESWQRIARRLAASDTQVLRLPVGSNLPDRREARERRRAALAVEGRVVIAQFGTTHPSRLDSHTRAVVDELTRRGIPAVLLNLGRTARSAGGTEVVREVRPGFLDAGDLAEHLSAADIFLSPCVDGVSTRRTSVMAALQHAVPVVGTAGPETDPEFRGDAGMRLVDVRDVRGFAAQVVDLAEHDEARRLAARAARQLYEREFDWEVIGRRAATMLDT